MKTFRKVLFYLLLAVSVLFITLLASVFLFKDRIINQFIQQVNKNLNTSRLDYPDYKERGRMRGLAAKSGAGRLALNVRFDELGELDE